MSRKRKVPPCSEEDRDLFLKYMGEENADLFFEQEITPPVKRQKPTPENERCDDKESFAKLFEDTLRDPEFIRKRDNLLPQVSKRKKAKPHDRTGPSAVLDLHACTLDVALSLTQQFINRSVLKRYKRVLIIHGKGSGVLLNGVRNYLAHHPQVSHIEDAPRHMGGSGAAMVFLRN